MKRRLFLVLAGLFLAVGISGDAFAGSGNPCGKNPCGMKNPCGANPCAANPCAKGQNKPIRGTHITDYKKLVAMGERLWNDEKLGASGLSCMSCHADHEHLNLDKVKGWPHFVKMTGDIVTLDQMVNYCMINPIAGDPLDPNSIEMTAMTAYYRQYAASFKKK